jgi:serine protease inhibitor
VETVRGHLFPQRAEALRMLQNINPKQLVLGLRTLRPTQISQEIFLALDEAVTEAAASTAIVLCDVSWPAPALDPVEVRVDRPFLFAVQHRSSGACLFLGRLVDPR